jgi:murein peptide amidase A
MCKQAWLIGVALVLLVGCQSGQTGVSSDAVLGRPAYLAGVGGWSVDHRPLMYRVYGNGEDVVLLMAGIHGNEAAGVPILEQLGRELMDNPQLLVGRTVVVLPEVNPDGVKANKRRNANGVDLNRNFPADNFDAGKGHGEEPLSQPESRAVLKQIERYKPSRIVTYHQPLKCVDYDGEGAQAIAEAMGEHTDLPVKRLGGRPGSLGSYFGIDRNIPCITFELPKDASQMSAEELWDRYGQATLAAIVYPEPLEAK